MQKYSRKLLLSVFFILISAVSLLAQETKSALGGMVFNETKQPVTSAQVVAVHTPTGTEYRTTTKNNGTFSIPNMNVGGPYKVTVSSSGFDTYTESDIELSLGTMYDLNVTLYKKVQQIEGVVIKGIRGTTKDKTGAETSVTSNQLRALPNVSGSLSDFVRVTPQVRTTDRQISINGQNNRYNAIYVDGGVNNDVFGLSPSGTDGGQTGGNPFALEELDQLTVSLSPFDVKQSGFAGGSINAVTKAGTNNLSGSAYFFTRTEKLSGKTASYNENERAFLPKFNAFRSGMSLGGPIIKNKLFFFTTYEVENLLTPKPFSFSQFLDQSNLSTNDLAVLRDMFKQVYKYDIGTYDDAKDKLVSDKFISRIDWNVNERNKISFKYKYTKFDYVTDNASSNTAINFSNGSQSFLSKTHYGALEWNSKINDKISNTLILSGKKVVDDRDFTGNPFPKVSLQTLGNRYINIGPEVFSTANYLEQDVYSLNDNLEISLNTHKFLIGTQHDFYRLNNLFIGNNFGAYTFGNQVVGGTTVSGLERFMQYYLYGNTAGNIPGTTTPYSPLYTSYTRSYPFSNPQGIGDDLINDGASAKFDVYQMGYYLQDTWKPNTKLTINMGIRADVPFYENTKINPDYNNITVPILEKANPGLEIPKTGEFIKPIIHWSPRLGFNYIPNPDSEYKTTIRGGTGIFTSRVPLVWAGGAYNNTGANLNAVSQVNIGTNMFIADPANQYTIPGQRYGGEVNVFVKDFKLPQRWKNSIGVDQKLPLGFNWTADFSYDKIINDVVYKNINLSQPVGTLSNGGDNRPRWNLNSVNDPRYGAIYLGMNTNKGYSYTISNTLSKRFGGFFASLSYMYNDAKTVMDGTSSQNSSQWRNLETVNGKNSDLPLSRSQFAIGSRVTGLVSYDFKWAKENMKTTLSFFYEGINGNPYSYVYNASNPNLIIGDDTSDNALIYIPKNRSDIVLQEGFQGLTSDYQWQILDKFIENDPYLRTRRGQYAERNSNRTPWSNVVDMRLLQDIKLGMGTDKEQHFQLSFDIFNLTNLLNKKWGLRYNNQNSATSFYSYRLIDVANVINNGDGTYTPVFGVNPENMSTRAIDQYNNSGVSSSVWQIQVGLRYFFK